MIKLWTIGISKTSDYIQIKIKMPNPTHEAPASSKAPNEDLKDMDVLCTFKIKIKSQNFDHNIIKTSDHIKIKIKMPNPSQEHPASSKASNEDLKGHGCFLHLQIKIESQNSDHGYIKV